MKKDICVSPYELQPRGALNARVSAAQPRRGFLIQLDGGYADCHPWPEFGDEPIEMQLKALEDGRPTPLLARSMHFAKLDAEARAAGRSLFEGLEIPESHFLCRGGISAEDGFEKQIAEAADLGFKKIKIKVGRDLALEAGRLKAFFKDGLSGIKLRFDFNSSATLQGLEGFLVTLGEDFMNRIDFLEDPLPFNDKSWGELAEKFRLRLALDQEMLLARVALESFETCVVKSARISAVEIADQAVSHLKRVVVTSMMDHPLGQLAAAYDAACVARKHPAVLDECGLLTHDVFEENAFSEKLRVRGARLQPVEGAGFGFQSELESLPWTKLS